VPGGVVLYINGAPCDSVGKRLNGRSKENNVSSQVRSEKREQHVKGIIRAAKLDGARW